MTYICQVNYVPFVAPARILPRHLHDQAFCFLIYLGAPYTSTGFQPIKICSRGAADTNPESYRAWPLPPRPPVPLDPGGERSQPVSPFLLPTAAAHVT